MPASHPGGWKKVLGEAAWVGRGLSLERSSMCRKGTRLGKKEGEQRGKEGGSAWKRGGGAAWGGRGHHLERRRVISMGRKGTQLGKEEGAQKGMYLADVNICVSLLKSRKQEL